jgi:hypothetical protein
MGWNRWYAAKSYLRSALWIVPLIALVIEQAAIRGLKRDRVWESSRAQLQITFSHYIGVIAAGRERAA